MIRCVPFDYYGSGRDNHVAFMDTVTDRFITINGVQSWESKKDLMEDEEGAYCDPTLIERLLAVSPHWFIHNYEAEDRSMGNCE